MDNKMNHFCHIDFALLKRTQKITPPTGQYL